MAMTFAQLKAKPVELQPVEVAITGFPEALLVHLFTMNQMNSIMESEPEAEEETVLRNQVLRFLNGFEYQPTAEDREELGVLFASWQLREFYSKAIRLNGYGPDALRDAQKN